MSVDLWVKAVMPRMSGAPEAFVRGEVARIISDFCVQSTALRNMTRGIDIVDGQREITVPTDDPQVVHIGVLRVYFRGRRLTEYSHAPWEYETDQPMGFTAQPGPPLVLTLMTIPTESIAGELDVFSYDKPADVVAQGVPPILAGEFFDPILQGVLASMYATDSKPYSNPVLARVHQSKYEMGVSKARAQAASGFTANAQGWVFPRFGV